MYKLTLTRLHNSKSCPNGSKNMHLQTYMNENRSFWTVNGIYNVLPGPSGSWLPATDSGWSTNRSTNSVLYSVFVTTFTITCNLKNIHD